jgi:putative ABC transport system permease protein
VYFADENLFDVFTVDVLKGNPKTALTDPFSVMLTEDEAKKYFGNEDPINKVIRANNQFDVKVTGIYKPFPSNAHSAVRNMLVSFNTLKRIPQCMVNQNLRTQLGATIHSSPTLCCQRVTNSKHESKVSRFS